MKDAPKYYHLFADLAEKQRKVKATMGKLTLEEARAQAKWIKTGRSNERKTREAQNDTDSTPDSDSSSQRDL